MVKILSGSGGVGFLAFDEVFGAQDELRDHGGVSYHQEQYRQIFLNLS